MITLEENRSSFSHSLVLVWVLIIVLTLILGAILQGLSKNIWALIFWRCLTGLFAGSPIVAQAYE